MERDLTDEEYKRERDKIHALSKNKGLDQWEAIFKNLELDIEKAKTTGLYVPQMGGYIKLYFDVDDDRWMYKLIDPIQS
jgi:hypothetical protein